MPEKDTYRSHPFWWNIVREFKEDKLAAASLGFILVIILAGIFAPFIALHNPTDPSLEHKLQPGFWAGNFEYPLGTDQLGRDIFSRIVYGTRLSLKVGLIVLLITAFLGILLGIVSAYYGKAIDLLLMRITDIFLAFPPLLLALAVVAVLGAGLTNAMIAISLVYIPEMARVVRGSVLSVKQLPYIEASKTIGTGDLTIMIEHILPNVFTSSIVFLTLLLADAILYTSSMGFLGIGIDPSTPEWGAMLSSGKDYLLIGYWWLTVFPGLIICMSVLSFNLLGDGLKEAFGPGKEL